MTHTQSAGERSGLQRIYQEFVRQFGDERPLSIISSSSQSPGCPVTHMGLRSFSQWYLPVSRWRSCTLLGTPPPATCFLYSNAAFQGWSSTVCGPVWGSAVPRAPQGGSSPLPPRPTRHCRLGSRLGRGAPGAWVSVGSQGAPVAHRHTPPCVLSVFVGSLCWIMEVHVEQEFSEGFYHQCLPREF